MKKSILTMMTTAGFFFTALTTQASAHEQNYTVKSGDVLWKIAANEKVSIQNLIKWNNLSATGNIYPKQTLTLLEPHSHDGTTYTVQSGDFLWKIANQFGMTVKELKSYNNITSDMLQVGQVLNIPGKGTATYTVKTGDLLWQIGAKHNLTVTELKQINHLSSNTIYPGQVLKVTNSAQTENIHTVKAGDTLWLIANQYKVTVSQLKTENNLTSDALYIGQKLTIPTGSVPAPDKQQSSPTPISMLQDGMFPLKAGSYQPYSNTYADSRTWSPDGTAPRAHEGVDIMAEKGTPIYAATDGKVVNLGWNDFGGWRLTVKANATTAIYYAHMQKYAKTFTDGETITKGQLIGYVGDSGYGPEGTTGKFPTHLHFGMYNTADSWKSIDPYPYLKNWEGK